MIYTSEFLIDFFCTQLFQTILKKIVSEVWASIKKFFHNRKQRYQNAKQKKNVTYNYIYVVIFKDAPERPFFVR